MLMQIFHFLFLLYSNILIISTCFLGGIMRTVREESFIHILKLLQSLKLQRSKYITIQITKIWKFLTKNLWILWLECMSLKSTFTFTHSTHVQNMKDGTMLKEYSENFKINLTEDHGNSHHLALKSLPCNHDKQAWEFMVHFRGFVGRYLRILQPFSQN